eukprot:6157681-Pleurochrysis_carterae.AAC.5
MRALMLLRVTRRRRVPCSFGWSGLSESRSESLRAKEAAARVLEQQLGVPIRVSELQPLDEELHRLGLGAAFQGRREAWTVGLCSHRRARASSTTARTRDIPCGCVLGARCERRRWIPAMKDS